MIITLKTAVEQSTYFPIISFLDEDENNENVKTLKWTLSDAFGNIINNRDGEEIINPSLVETIVLSGDDLAIFGDNDLLKRVLTIQATYDSDLGNDLPLNGEGIFNIIPLIAIPNEAAL